MIRPTPMNPLKFSGPLGRMLPGMFFLGTKAAKAWHAPDASQHHPHTVGAASVKSNPEVSVRMAGTTVDLVLPTKRVGGKKENLEAGDSKITP